MPPISAADHYRRRAGELRSLAADGRPWDALRVELVQLAQRYDRLAAEVDARLSPAQVSQIFPRQRAYAE
jgi:hypothetical protein